MSTTARGAMSPSSSPRLPSPPPMPELQFGPQSPLAGPGEVEGEANNKTDKSARRRIRPGTKAADMVRGPPLIPLTQVDSAFPLQEHLKALYAYLMYGQDPDHVTAMTKEIALQLVRPPQLEDGETADRDLWLYELCRFLTMKAGLVSCALMADNPACSSITCPEMRASEWQYLCAVHEPPKSCCAIDYVNHTLDWAANALTSTKHFPSRLQLGGESVTILQSMRQLTNIFRRVYRIFAHAWFQHREVFWHIESTHGIYILFKTVCDEYGLIPPENYTIPAEAEGPRDELEMPANARSESQVMSMQILRKDAADALSQNGSDSSPPRDVPAATARRHRHTPSTGSHVTTITEDEEDVPPVPSISIASSKDSNATPSPERKAREALGKLDISASSPSVDADEEADSQLEAPTPTAAPVADPLAAAGAASRSIPKKPEHIDLEASNATPTATSALNTSSGPPKPQITTQPAPTSRRTSDFESEVHSPGGGSIRTAGPDLLNAILGHMDDKEREEVEAQRAAEQDGANESEETVLFVGEEQNGSSENKKTRVADEEDKATDNNESTRVGRKGVGNDEDDDEMMEEIMLPHRREAGN